MREQAPPEVPAGWESGAAEGLAQTGARLRSAGEDFAATDDDLSSRVDAVSAAVRDGASQLSQIREDHRINRARLEAFAGVLDGETEKVREDAGAGRLLMAPMPETALVLAVTFHVEVPSVRESVAPGVTCQQ